MPERRFRFAPTPSRLLHVGNGLAALIGWAAARHQRGAFILRIEDIDATRCKPEYEAACFEDLRWLGLDWDEGPDVGGPHEPYRQSERLERFDAALQDLVTRGAAYPCTCSRADIRTAQSAPHLHAAGERPYPGTCRGRGHSLEDRGGYRLDVEALGDAAEERWSDSWLGPQREDVRQTCGDFLLGRPGAPSYQLAVSVDDEAMQITDVVRGRDLLGSTGRQRVLHRHLDNEPPRFAHHPLLLDTNDDKLSKRDDALTLRALREGGCHPEALIAAVARAIGLVSPETRRLDAAHLVALLSERPDWRDGCWTDLS